MGDNHIGQAANLLPWKWLLEEDGYSGLPADADKARGIINISIAQLHIMGRRKASKDVLAELDFFPD